MAESSSSDVTSNPYDMTKEAIKPYTRAYILAAWTYGSDSKEAKDALAVYVKMFVEQVNKLREVLLNKSAVEEAERILRESRNGKAG